LAFAADAVIYLWDLNGCQMASELLQVLAATFREARTSAARLRTGLFCIFGGAS
jgi:hypothetical protein